MDKKMATVAIHADRELEPEVFGDIAPAIHVSTTYQVDNKVKMHYSRNDQPTRQRAEHLLGRLEEGTAVMYSSGMAATFAVLHHYRPTRVAIERGYHVTHDALKTWYTKDDVANHIISFNDGFQKGDLIWLETPKNPACEIYDIADFASKAHAAGAVLIVDSTFASPILQKPLSLGADLVMHSCTKFLGGHDDVLCGALISKDPQVATELKAERTILGSVPGSLECFLLLRSLRTLSLRVERQSQSACRVAQFLASQKGVKVVHHPSLASHPDYELCRKQMRAPPGLFSVEFDTVELTHQVLKSVKLFCQATSLGGVMSLVDWRHRRDPSQPETLLRVTIGLEDPDDLIADLHQALTKNG